MVVIKSYLNINMAKETPKRIAPISLMTFLLAVSFTESLSLSGKYLDVEKSKKQAIVRVVSAIFWIDWKFRVTDFGESDPENLRCY